MVSKKELKAEIVESDLIVDLKGSSSNVSVMKCLHLFFVHRRVLVRIMP